MINNAILLLVMWNNYPGWCLLFFVYTLSTDRLEEINANNFDNIEEVLGNFCHNVEDAKRIISGRGGDAGLYPTFQCTTTPIEVNMMLYIYQV